MSTERPKVSRQIVRALNRESGNKCANPGCPNHRIEIHHIKEWHVYQTHDEKHMIAICPACHDAVHNGHLRIDDDTLYQWKAIYRPATNRDYLYIEPGKPCTMQLGTIDFRSDTGLLIFRLSNTSELQFRVVDGDIFMTSLKLTDEDGKEIVRVTDNHVKYILPQKLVYHRRSGRFRITAPTTQTFFPDWALTHYIESHPDFARDSTFTLIDVEVKAPARVSVQGLWVDTDTVVMISEECIDFILPGGIRSFGSYGDKTKPNPTFHYNLPIDKAFFETKMGYEGIFSFRGSASAAGDRDA